MYINGQLSEDNYASSTLALEYRKAFADSYISFMFSMILPSVWPLYSKLVGRDTSGINTDVLNNLEAFIVDSMTGFCQRWPTSVVPFVSTPSQSPFFNMSIKHHQQRKRRQETDLYRRRSQRLMDAKRVKRD